MTATADLARAAGEARALIAAEPGVREVEVFAAENRALLTRLNYTSHIPCNGVEEPKSSESSGLGVRVVLDSPEGPQVGFGAEPSDLGPEGARRAFARARRAAVPDPAFESLPRPSRERRSLVGYHDPALLAMDDDTLVEVGWRVVRGAVGTFLGSSRLAELAGSEAGLRRLGLVVGGDVTILQERIAVASTALPGPETDASTLLMAFVTAMVEAADAKGSGWSAATRLDDWTDEAGVEAAQNAIGAVGGVRVPAGDYAVVFGPQPVTDLMNNLVIPACHAGAFYSSSTPFLGKLGARVASPLLSLRDDGARPGLVGSKGITCEGLPTGRTDLIRDGVLVGCLASWYDSRRLLRDPDIRGKLGVDAGAAAPALVPRNGFRYGGGGGRAFDRPPGTAATNVIVEGAAPMSREELCRRVDNGLYIGRIWYTYPINGLRAGDFTCTVVGDSYIIRDGRITAPLQANAVRLNDNVLRVLDGITGIGERARATLVWAADEIVHAPEIAVASVHADEISPPREEGS
ncbi:MAG: metallopeptidase TldD-related protein [Candidatus Rokubacteria bacterium]|nr:metallopeptidase TldD-related protein [Candidatus Rokubacteria bacterium]